MKQHITSLESNKGIKVIEHNIYLKKWHSIILQTLFIEQTQHNLD